MKRRAVRLAVQAIAVLFGGFVAAVAGLAAASALHPADAWAATSVCQATGSTATITLNGSTVTLSDVSGNLTVSAGGGSSSTCGSFTSGTPITTITFVTGTETSQTVILDNSAGSAFPCGVTFGGTAGTGSTQNALFEIKAALNTGVTVGSDGMNMNGCGASQGLPTGVGAWKLVADGVSTMSADGVSAGNASTVPVTFVAGLGAETFDSSTPATTLDFSQVGATCPCTLGVNTTTGAPSGINPDTATLSYTVSGSPTTVSYTFGTTGSDFTTFDGLAGGSTTFYAGGTPGYAFNATGSANAADFSAAQSAVTVNLLSGPGTPGAPGTVTFSTGGTDSISGITTITGSPSGGNHFTAGPSPSTYNFTAAGASNTFVGGSGNDSFTVTGNNNVFQVGTATLTTMNAASTTGNTVDFSALTGAVSVNVTGGALTSPAVANDEAVSGSSTYDFTSFATTPATFKASQGGTTFYAGANPGYTFTGYSGTGTADFSSLTTTPVTVNLSGGTSGTVTLPSGSDTLTGVTTVVGSPGGGNTFTAGPSPEVYDFTGNGTGNTFIGGTGVDTFNSTGSGNTFKVGSGNATINDSGTGNTIDFSGLTTALVLNVTGSSITSLSPHLANDTASSNGAIYTFTSFGTTPATFKGPAAGATFYAGASGGYSFVGGSGTNTVDFSADTNSVTANLSTAAYTTLATSPIPGVVVGSNQVLVANPGTSSASCSTSPTPAYCDNLSGVTQVFGSKTGDNTFVAGVGSENFGDYGTGGGDAIDFSNVPTGSGTVLTVNVSGSPYNGSLNLATVGSSAYNILAGQSNFTTFTGSASANGSTTFVAGSTGGYTFIGHAGSADSAVFLGGSGVVVNLSGGSVTTSAQIGPSTSLSDFTLGFDQVLVTNPAPASACASTLCDTLNNITTVTGPSSGYSTFYAGPGTSTYTFSDQGDHNTFYGGSGSDAFSSGGNYNTFVAGSGSATFSETASSATAQGNTIDFSNVPVGSTPGCSGSPCTLVINVSGSLASVPNDGAAVINSANVVVSTYSFAVGGSDFATFKGATGGATTFYGGLGAYTYIGQGASNTLDFSRFVPTTGGTLTFDVTHTPSPQATLQGVPETFSGITNLVGLSTGDTTFVAGSTGGYSFVGNQSGNQADFSTEGPSTTLTVTVTSSVAITGGTVTFSLAGGAPLCSSVPVVANGTTATASCSTSSLPAGPNQVVAVYTPPSGSAYSGSGYVLTVGSGAGAVPTTSVSVPSISPTPVAGSSVTLTATVSVNSLTVPIAPGTLTFVMAGNGVLCTASVPGNSVTAETVSCNGVFPAGTFDVQAVYTPTGSTVTGSAAQLTGVTVTSPVVQTSTSVSIGSCISDFFNESCTVTATVITASGVAPSAGTVEFSLAGGGGTVYCGTVALSVSGTSGTAVCTASTVNSGVTGFAGQAVIAVYTPSSSSFSASAGVSGPLPSGSFVFSDTQTSTTLSAVPAGSSSPSNQVIEGTVTTFTAVVDSSSSLPGGTMTFSVAGSTTLCVVQVPSGVLQATLECQASLPSAGYNDVLAVYSPSGFGFAGSAFDDPLTVLAPDSSSSLLAAISDLQAGVDVNLSNSAATGTVVTGPSTTASVTLGTGQVLLAAPNSGATTCSVSPLPSFCDRLSGITTVTGSDGGHNTFVAGTQSEVFADNGTVGSDTIDFSKVPTGSSSATLTVNVTGGSGSYTASVLSGPTYTFTAGGSGFTSFIGPALGYTTYRAGPAPGYSFTASGPGDQIDFSAAGPVVVNLSSSPQGGLNPGLVAVGGGTDSISGLTYVIGSSGGSNTFYGGPGPQSYTFSALGSGNRFVAGPGSDTFVDPGANNRVDFSLLTATTVVVNRSSTTLSPTAPNSATSTVGGVAGGTYTFGSAATIFVGAPGGTTFYAGNTADTFNGQAGTANTLGFQYANGSSLTVCVVAQSGSCGAGQASLSGTTEGFSNISSFFGLGPSTGNTTFVAGSGGGLSFTGYGTGNVMDFSGDTNSITVNLSGSPYTTSSTASIPNVTVGPGQVLVAAPGTSSPTCAATPLPGFCDALSGITTIYGSASAGGNTFVAGTSAATFLDRGTVGGDTLDLSHISSTTQTSPMVINATASISPGGVSPYTAAGTATYTFDSYFTHFVGAGSGYTTFLAGSVGGLTFRGIGTGNTADFSADTSPVTANLSTGSYTTSAANPDGSGVTVAGGSVLVGVGTCPSMCDTVSDVSTLAGSLAGGNTFVAGAASETFENGTGNTVDFSNLSTPVVVNVSTPNQGPIKLTSYGTASTSSGTVVYNFSSFASSPTVFVGSPGGTTFFAGQVADTYLGSGPASANTLSFAYSPSGPLLVCVVQGTGCLGAGQAQLSTVVEPFADISTFDGLLGGSTTFFAGSAGGLTFSGSGSGNVLDLSADSNSITANLSGAIYTTSATAPIPNVTVGGNQVLVSSPGATPPSCSSVVLPGFCDAISGITTVYGSTAKGHNTFVVGGSGASLGDLGTAGGDTIDFSNVSGTTPTSPLLINASGKSDVTSPYTATFGTLAWTFSAGGSNFTNFVGALGGNTDFLVSGTTTGFGFTAQGGGNTLDVRNNTSGVTVDLFHGTLGLSGVTGSDTLLTANGGVFSTVYGSPSGANVFYGALTGTLFSSTSSTNTLSYQNLSAALSVDMTAGTVTGPAGSDSFSFPYGNLTVEGSSGADTLIGGSRSVTLWGGGGTVSIDLSRLGAGATVNLSSGQITANGAGTICFDACAVAAVPSAPPISISQITGTPYNDVFTVAASAPVVNIVGNGGTDTLDLSTLTTKATVDMATGTVTVTNGTVTTTVVTSSGISNLIGTQPGGDTVLVGAGTEKLLESGSPGTIDFSTSPNAIGVQVGVSLSNGTPTGSATNSLATINTTFIGFTTIDGTPYGDSFTQTGPGSFVFNGGQGNNTLTFSGLPTGVVVTLTADPTCASGNSDGTAVLSGSVNDTFSCMYQVNSGGTLTFDVSPGESTTLNGGGNGQLQLTGATGGATINLQNGTVSGGGYQFSFSGMSVIDGTPYNDLFVAGPGSYTLNGMGGSDTITFAGAPAAVVVNDSASPYTIPAGLPGAGTVVPADTATGGYGGTYRLNGISDLIGTSIFNDILVAGPNVATIIGGAGSDRFVLTGGTDYLFGGSGSSTLDLSMLNGPTSLDLATSSLQPLGGAAGYLSLAGGNITTVIASPGGSQIWGGTGNITLLGGPGGDWLAAGTGTQTLVGGGGTDTLVGGVGNDTLQGGSQPVTFVPGQGSDTLTSSTSGNTLDYAGGPAPVQVNLSTQLYSVPAGEPFAGTALAPQTATGGWGATVNLVGANIGVVDGTGGADIFVTGPTGSTVNGDGGPDLFVIDSGNNTLNAAPGSGARFLFTAAGSNVVNGGGNGTVDFSQDGTGTGVTVNLQTGNAYGPPGWFEKLTGIVNIIGSNYNDVLVLGSQGGTVYSLAGNDLIQSAAGGGSTLIGGDGNDTFCAQSSCAVAGTVAGGGDIMLGGSGNDVFYAQNGVPDVINGGGGYNVAFTDPVEKSVTNIQQQIIS